jgi:hypothetical protein
MWKSRKAHYARKLPRATRTTQVRRIDKHQSRTELRMGVVKTLKIRLATHRALGHYCIDNDKTMNGLADSILSDWLTARGYPPDGPRKPVTGVLKDHGNGTSSRRR